MNYTQNLTIPILQLRPRMNSTGCDKYDSNINISSPNLSSLNIRKEKMFGSSEIPFTIKKLERNPKDILEKRAAMTERDGNEKFLHMDRGDKAVRNDHDDRFADNQHKDISKKNKNLQDLPEFINNGVRKEKLCESRFFVDIESEIESKLFYLDIIQQLKESIEMERFVAYNEKVKYLQKIEMLETEKSDLLKLYDRHREAENFTVKSQQLHEKCVEFNQDFLMNGTVTRDDEATKGSLDSSLILPQDPCMKFSNLFDLSGQLHDFCLGEFGSRFVIERLKNGASPEKKFAMKELKLPSNLLLLLENQFSADVAIVLATIEHQGQADIMSYIQDHSSLILSKSYGIQLFTDVLSIASETDKLCVAQSALNAISKLQDVSDEKLIKILRQLTTESV